MNNIAESMIAETQSTKSLTIAMVAGEASGDLLGANLICALKSRFPGCQFIGIGGEKMQALGFQSLYPMERLAVMGIVDVLPRLWELLKMRKALAQRLQTLQPDLFVGIDAPDFNLGLEKKLKQAGITTAHYVSPSVWAWRQGRIKKIKQAVDLMLTVFPFEARFYEQHNAPVAFVGHPLADEIPLQADAEAARKQLNIPLTKTVLAVLPGSRKGELHHLGPVFLETMQRIKSSMPDIEFLIPAANAERKAQLEEMIRQQGTELLITLVDGQAQTVMAAANAVLITSGTATLEAMLLKRPMVVAYQWGKLSHWLISPFVKTPYIALPNLLAGEQIVEEYVQQQVSPEKLAEAVKRCFNAQEMIRLQQRFTEIHRQLRLDAGAKAASALAQLLQKVES